MSLAQSSATQWVFSSKTIRNAMARDVAGTLKRIAALGY